MGIFVTKFNESVRLCLYVFSVVKDLTKGDSLEGGCLQAHSLRGLYLPCQEKHGVRSCSPPE